MHFVPERNISCCRHLDCVNKSLIETFQVCLNISINLKDELLPQLIAQPYPRDSLVDLVIHHHIVQAVITRSDLIILKFCRVLPM